MEHTQRETRRTPRRNPTRFVSIVQRRPHAQSEVPFKKRVEKIEDDDAIEFTDYGVARVIAKVIAFMGWIMFVLGLVVIGYAVAHIDGTKNIDVILVIVLPGIGMMVSGLFLIVAGQITRATVNNTSHTKQILLQLRAYLRQR